MSMGIETHDLDKPPFGLATGPQLDCLYCDATARALSELAEFAFGKLDENMPAPCSVQGNKHVRVPASERSPDGQPLT